MICLPLFCPYTISIKRNRPRFVLSWPASNLIICYWILVSKQGVVFHYLVNFATNLCNDGFILGSV